MNRMHGIEKEDLPNWTMVIEKGKYVRTHGGVDTPNKYTFMVGMPYMTNDT